MKTIIKKQKTLVSIDEWVHMHEDNVAEAARQAGADYIPFFRWYKRTVFAPNHASTRSEMENRGIDLPRRPLPGRAKR